MSKIKVKWARKISSNHINFGDDLGPLIIKKITGMDIIYVHYAKEPKDILLSFVKDVFKGRLTLSLIKHLFTSFFTKEYLISIGSILQWYSSSRCIVWGAGIIDNSDIILPSKKYHAVRGYYTLNKISRFCNVKNVKIGDPALLSPLIFKVNNKKKYKLGIIPHVKHYAYFKNKIVTDDILLIDLSAPNLEETIKKICQCEYTISTSLHGLIISHAYNIKSLWYELENHKLQGDNIKFHDYFSSVKIPEYVPFKINESTSLNPQDIIQNILIYEKYNSINIDLYKLQINLLKSFPYRLKQRFNNLINSK